MWSACRSLMTTVVVVVVVVVIEDGMEKSDNLRLPPILVRRVDINARVTATKNTEDSVSLAHHMATLRLPNDHSRELHHD